MAAGRQLVSMQTQQRLSRTGYEAPGCHLCFENWGIKYEIWIQDKINQFNFNIKNLQDR